ncbi:MAG: YfcE family phosphodiesterase [Candidatus Lokiarchaeota archaeon]|nr:YfcE family phosphodiesterase [Candidatus Lokiarchaeota archaeon]MCK4480191.1 YfcE family phosphodiesterase [Candidatus Lokiarchaeota archaeon]
MVRILCIGDSHIPVRAKDLPMQIYNKINELTSTELFDYTFFTGDLINFPELLDFLNQKTKRSLFKVIGNMDYYYGNRDSPTYQKLDVFFEENDKITLGLTHGAQIRPRGDHDQLEILAQENGYNILVSGHTHKEEVYLTKKGILLINPGSITGAWSFLASCIPSFVELSIDEKTKEIFINLFQIDKQNREIEVLEINFGLKINQIYKKI